jgi:hypothetical protein
MDHFRYKDFNNSVRTSWEAGSETEANTRSEADEMRSILMSVADAIVNYGAPRDKHTKILTKHRTEWPFLWEQLDRVSSFALSEKQESADNDETGR